MEDNQLRSVFIVPVLQGLGLYSQEAEDLMVGTFAQESGCGRYVRQLNGPALGYWMMEAPAHDEIVRTISVRVPQFSTKIQEMCKLSRGYDYSLLLDNIRYACCFARLHYWLKSDPIPKNLNGQAEYWKTYYNANQGKGTAEEYINNYLIYTGKKEEKKEAVDETKKVTKHHHDKK